MTASIRAIELATLAAQAASDKLGTQIVAIDVSEKFPLADIFLIVSAANDRQVKSIVDAVEEKLATIGVKSVHEEGVSEGRWALLDFNDVVVHVQHIEERVFYDLERLWRDCPTIELDLVQADER
ncbi:MAG: ribosome silencing factor [Candidatus Nanopelagicales bacterium]